MSEPSKSERTLSEISHLFLSSVREKQSQGASRPVRTPPPAPRTDCTVDLTPEEFAEVFGEQIQADPACDLAIGPVSAVLASHLAAQQLGRVLEYASSLAAGGKRIGLIAVDASEFRLSVIERSSHEVPRPAQAQENDVLDARQMSEALSELAWDVDQWLLLLPSPRAPEARSLLRDVDRWVLLTTCDHDGVVACYRTLKGLADLHRPALSLALLGAGSAAEAQQVEQRIASVCRQFLNWPLEEAAPLPAPSARTGEVREHVVLWCCSTRDKGQLAIAPQWQVVADFIAKAKASPASPAAAASPAPAETAATHPDEAPAGRPRPEAPPAMAIGSAGPIPAAPSLAEMPGAAASAPELREVIDLPDAAASGSAIVSAVLRGGRELVECPLKPPMCPEASLAVARDHRLVLLAVAQQGLHDLRQIGRAYQWLVENRALVGMALPQMAIDAHQLPRLHLLVDHADMTAEVLQPMLQSTAITVHAYRKLRWGGKTGLLLEAA